MNSLKHRSYDGKINCWYARGRGRFEELAWVSVKLLYRTSERMVAIRVFRTHKPFFGTPMRYQELCTRIQVELTGGGFVGFLYPFSSADKEVPACCLHNHFCGWCHGELASALCIIRALYRACKVCTMSSVCL